MANNERVEITGGYVEDGRIYLGSRDTLYPPIWGQFCTQAAKIAGIRAEELIEAYLKQPDGRTTRMIFMLGTSVERSKKIQALPGYNEAKNDFLKLAKFIKNA